MNVLITGAGGFVGSHLLFYLMNKLPENKYFALVHNNYDTHYFDALVEEYEVSGVNKKVLYGDVADYDFMRRIVLDNDISLIIHLGAQAIVSKAEKNPRDAAKTNIMGTLNILEIVKEFQMFLIYQSTDKVYGEVENATTEFPLKPVDFYGATKAASEHLIEFYTKLFPYTDSFYYQTKTGEAVAAPHILVLRPCNIFGLDPHIGRLIPDIIIKCFEGQNPRINKPNADNKFPVRQFIHISDYCEIVGSLVQNHLENFLAYVAERGYVLNIGTPYVYSTFEVTKRILNLAEGYFAIKDKEIEYKESTNTKEITTQSLFYEKDVYVFLGLANLFEPLNNADTRFKNRLFRTMRAYYNYFQYADRPISD